MITHPIASAPEALTDVLIWDEKGGEWRVGHQRTIAYTGELYWIDGSVADADSLIEDEQPVSVFSEPTHWSPLPPKLGAWA